jgi:glycosyltransferase involved in cell wall biosynthesis
MRVLYLNSGNLFGGIEVLLVTLARHRELAPEMAPEFAVCFPGKIVAELNLTGVPVHELGPVRASRPWTVWRVRRRLRALLRSRSFDVVVCHGTWVQAIFGPVIRAAELPCVLWLHDPPAPSLHWIDRWASWSAPDLAICNSDYTLAGLAHLYPKVRGERVHCPVSLPVRAAQSDRNETRQAYAAGPDDVVILQIGRWEPHKGHLLHMEALGLLAREPGWVCWQVGGTQRASEEAYRKTAMDATQRHGVAERVRFLGYQPDVRRLLDAADIYCQPNVEPEPFGISFIEAMMAGLPVVGTNLGGPKEIIDESCGLLVKPGDASALAEALSSLIRDRALRECLGRGGPARASGISDPADRLAQLANLFADLLAPTRADEESLCKQ